MTFNDIFKSSFLENIGGVSILDMAIALALAFGIGMFIFLVYKKTYQGVMYSSSFGTTLIALTMITTVVILAVTSNVVLSLGMVGALSIVRFRTAIKEPLDIAFLFWAMILFPVFLSAISILCFSHLCPYEKWFHPGNVIRAFHGQCAQYTHNRSENRSEISAHLPAPACQRSAA